MSDLSKFETKDDVWLDDQQKQRVLQKRAKQAATVDANCKNRPMEAHYDLGGMVLDRLVAARRMIDYCLSIQYVEKTIGEPACLSIKSISDDLAEVMAMTAAGLKKQMVEARDAQVKALDDKLSKLTGGA